MKVEIKFSDILDCLKAKYPTLSDDTVITIDRTKCFSVILSKHSDAKIYLQLKGKTSVPDIPTLGPLGQTVEE